MNPDREHLDEASAEPSAPLRQQVRAWLFGPPRRRRTDKVAAVASVLALLAFIVVAAGTGGLAGWEVVGIVALGGCLLGIWAEVLPPRWERSAPPVRAVAAVAAVVGIATVLVGWIVR